MSRVDEMNIITSSFISGTPLNGYYFTALLSATLPFDWRRADLASLIGFFIHVIGAWRGLNVVRNNAYTVNTTWQPLLVNNIIILYNNRFTWQTFVSSMVQFNFFTSVHLTWSRNSYFDNVDESDPESQHTLQQEVHNQHPIRRERTLIKWAYIWCAKRMCLD